MQTCDHDKTLSLEMEDETISGPCPCCGNMTRVVWGTVYQGDFCVAAYYVQWTPDDLEHHPNFDLILGEWGDGKTNDDRVAVSLCCQVSDLSYMVIDAADRAIAEHSLVGRTLAREEVIGTELAHFAFAVVDVVSEKDPRIAEFRRGVK